MILGLVRWLQPVHGYDVRRELMSWNVGQWADVQAGSVYHALKKLTSEGMLAEVATEQVGARPTRTTYRVTPKGEVEFRDLLRKYGWEQHPTVDPFMAAVAFLPAFTRREAVVVFRHRGRTARAKAIGMRDMLAEGAGFRTEKPDHVAWMFELECERAEVEAAWCDRVADRIERGEGISAGDGVGDGGVEGGAVYGGGEGGDARGGEDGEQAMARRWREVLGSPGEVE